MTAIARVTGPASPLTQAGGSSSTGAHEELSFDQQLDKAIAASKGMDVVAGVPRGAQRSVLEMPMLLPTPGNIAKLSTRLEASLGAAFERAGISVKPAVSFEADRMGRLYVKGDRPDTERIEAMLAADPVLSQEIRNLKALGQGAKVAQIAELASAEHKAARTQPEIDAVHRKYLHLMNAAPVSVALSFDGAVYVHDRTPDQARDGSTPPLG